MAQVSRQDIETYRVKRIGHYFVGMRRTGPGMMYKDYHQNIRLLTLRLAVAYRLTHSD
jgi:hypothetical protein